MENHIADTTNFLNDENIFDDQIRLEYFKYKLKNTYMHFSTSQSKKNKEIQNLENKIKFFCREFD